MRRFVLAAISLSFIVAGCGGSSHQRATKTLIESKVGGATAPTIVLHHRVTATSVATAMIDRGVPARIAFTWTAANDPNKLLGRQGGYTSKVSLQDRRLPKVPNFLAKTASSTDGGAALECYPIGRGALLRYRTLKTLLGTVIGDGYDYDYDYVSGSCVLRLTSDLVPTQAHQYRHAFEAATN